VAALKKVLHHVFWHFCGALAASTTKVYFNRIIVELKAVVFSRFLVVEVDVGMSSLYDVYEV